MPSPARAALRRPGREFRANSEIFPLARVRARRNAQEEFRVRTCALLFAGRRCVIVALRAANTNARTNRANAAKRRPRIGRLTSPPAAAPPREF